MRILSNILQRLSVFKRSLGQPSIAWTLCFSLVILLLLHTADVFAPSGRWLYDHASQRAYDWHWSKQATAKGVYQQRPVLIAVDEASLQTLGRWPWSRKVHAQLLNTLAASAAPPSVLAWDVVFSEPHITGVQGSEQGLASDDDAIFTRAINGSGFPVLLATQLEEATSSTAQRTQSLRLIAPRAPLNTSTARIAHIHIDADVDGSVRRYWPVDTRLSGVSLPYLGSALRTPTLAYPIVQLSAPLAQSQASTQATKPTAGLPSEQGEWLYPMPANWVRQISYQDVLSGAAPSAQWAGVPLLVAATAKGLGDQYVTHLYQPSSVVAGGELVLGAMHTEQLHAAGLPRLGMAHWAWESLVLLVLMGGVLYGLRRCERIRSQLGVLLVGLITVAVLSVGVLAYLGVWLNAALLGVGVVVSWMLWMSYALQRFVAHIQHRLAQLGHLPTAFKHHDSTAHAVNATLKKSDDAMGGQLSAVAALEQRQQTEFTRLNQVLDLLPDAAFVLSAGEGLSVYLHNLAARQLCLRCPAAQAATDAPQTTLNGLLADFVPDLTQEQQTSLSALKTQTVFHWQDLLTHHGEPAFAQGIEANSAKGERFLIKVAQLLEVQTIEPKPNSQSIAVHHLIVSIIDLSVGLTLAQSRERTLNFLSHDIRAPQANIVALLDLEKAAHPDLEGLFSKIQFQAQRTLHLAEGFVQWSQASHRPAYQFIEYNLNELMIDALDEQWASAKRKGIHLTGYSGDDALWVMIDRSLLWRALVNLISNALNACVAGQEIRLSTRQEDEYAVITVEDNGPGIPAAQHAHLFEPFVQGAGLKRTGAGLGLAFVKNVMDQHQGLVKLHSPVFDMPQPHGTRFELWLPLAPEAQVLESIEPL
jgi:signal transduction histidine kinase/CHASE2 domain-containing sensor protein